MDALKSGYPLHESSRPAGVALFRLNNVSDLLADLRYSGVTLSASIIISRIHLFLSGLACRIVGLDAARANVFEVEFRVMVMMMMLVRY